jgi:hypothetical protein
MKGGAIFLAGVAAILPSAAAFSESKSAPADQVLRFAPSDGPLILTRTVWRALVDGKEIISRKRYAVQIVPDGDGFQVTGQLIDSAVDAPPALAALAEMERRRPEASLLPIQLDAGGRILPCPRASDPAAHQQGARVAQRLIQASQITRHDKDQAESLIDQIANAGGIAQWPTDLFNPSREIQREKRRVALPGGSEGAIEVSITVDGLHYGNLPGSVERTVVTELEGTRKITREQWTFGSDSAPSSQ